MKRVQIKNQYRNLDINSGNIDEENRTVELSFSSEEPVERHFGIEILDHNEKSVDLSRLNNSAAVLEDHDWGRGQIGVVEKAEIRNGKGYAKLRFSKVGRGAEVWQDIVDGIRRNISFGYQLRDLTRSRDEEKDGIPTYRSMDWLPFEISVVGVPADPTIGIGRSKEESNEIEVDEDFLMESDTEEKTLEETQDFNLTEKYKVKLAKMRADSLKSKHGVK